MRVGSLFSGDGLLDFGLHLAGLEHSWLCEIDPWRRELLAKRWPGVPIFDDVRAVDGSAPRVDLLVGGFPCRGASTAGNRTGLDHPETALWWEMARVIRLLRPRLVLIENVANLLTVPPEQPGRAWGEVLGELASQRYVVAWDCLPAAAFGAPHLRDRVFLIAADADQSRSNSHPAAGRSRAPVGQRDIPAANADRTERQERDGTQPSGQELATADARAAPHADGYGLRQQPERERGSCGPAESGIADEGVGPCGCFWEVIDADGFCACCEAHIDDPDGLYALQGDGTHSHPGCPAATDLHRSEPPAGRDGSGEHGVQADSRRAPADWGDYQAAIERWEEVAGPAPEPLLRGVDARAARRVVRSRLSALGDGVFLGAGVFLGTRIRELFEDQWGEGSMRRPESTNLDAVERRWLWQADGPSRGLQGVPLPKDGEELMPVSEHEATVERVKLQVEVQKDQLSEAAVLEQAAKHFERIATARELRYVHQDLDESEHARDVQEAKTLREAAVMLRSFIPGPLREETP